MIEENSKLPWPAIYIDMSLDESLMIVSHSDWFLDVDIHHTIGEITTDGHFLVAENGLSYPLRSRGEVSGVPVIEIGTGVRRREVTMMVKMRASKWDGIDSEELSDIISQLKK